MDTAQQHMAGMDANERGQRHGYALKMIELGRQLHPGRDVHSVNPDYIAFADLSLLEEWVVKAEQLIAQHQAQAAQQLPVTARAGAGSKRKA
jgi:hypothetical protein